jgi:hypothetical protein
MDAAKLESVDDVFAAFGGPTTVARALDLKGPSTASEMKRRSSIPVNYWERLVEVAPDFGVTGLTYEKLVRMHTDAAPDSRDCAEGVRVS